ncbi:MAG: AgmX/PglI C-terminal domain-containing protein [Myxococcales bacterium]|nr:AgmX/PglI C-terminal domain-containing protein [Myxococcales bacterium]
MSSVRVLPWLAFAALGCAAQAGALPSDASVPSAPPAPVATGATGSLPTPVVEVELPPVEAEPPEAALDDAATDEAETTDDTVAGRLEPCQPGESCGAFASLLGEAHGVALADALTGAFGASGISGIGNGPGTGGLGLGGGGTGTGTIGLGSLGTLGHGTGTGTGPGYGTSAARLQGSTRPSSAVRPGAATAVGSMDPAIAQRIVRRHTAKMRYCYERALLTSPNLEARLVAAFTIGADGAVKAASADGSGPAELKACIRGVLAGMTFPQPTGGGIVTVRYPFTFTSATPPTPTPTPTPTP